MRNWASTGHRKFNEQSILMNELISMRIKNESTLTLHVYANVIGRKFNWSLKRLNWND
ncbi:MAG: hypothetical protein ACTS80_01285 [Candidatus Hodgkinia cicadicola]